MGLRDFEVFIQERLHAADSNLDISPGSPMDVQVIQPLLRRLGTDPFTMDAATFIVERLAQEMPDLAAGEGDAISDVLLKPALLLWDPIIREVQRIKNMLSTRDPMALTLDEAEALGANVFAERNRGSVARGVGRIYFAQPQSIRIGSTNFFTSKSGLHFFPTTVQAIRSDEMLLNREGDLYYLDVNLIAEDPGEAYNIESSELVSIANVPAAVRVTNKARFRRGLDAEDAPTFLGRLDQELSERSLVTPRGISAKLPRAFPEITRHGVVGFNDPEMQRDVIVGGSLGTIMGSGLDATVVPDGLFRSTSSHVAVASADFYALIGPTGPVSGWVLTLFDAWGPGHPPVQDLNVLRVVNQTTLEVDVDTLKLALGMKAWCLRKRELSLSSIPGGILFPDGPNGTVEVPSGTIHIGGCTDVHVGSGDFDTATLVLDALSDANPALQGTALQVSAGQAELTDLVLGTTYHAGDATDVLLQEAVTEQYTLEILEGVNAGAYRALRVTTSLGTSPVVTVDPPLLNVAGSFRWRLLDVIDVDLVEPQEVRISAATGQTVQHTTSFTTSPAVDLGALGVSPGDVLRIYEGINAGDFDVVSVGAPSVHHLVVDRPFKASQAGIFFMVFRPNGGGGVTRPLVRISDVELLDTSAQPLGIKVPYARPVDVRSRAFQNPGIGEKVTATNATLGIVTRPIPLGGFTFGASDDLSFTWDGAGGPLTVTFSGTLTAADIRDAINAAATPLGYEIAMLLHADGQDYVGVSAVGPGMRTTLPSSAAHSILFGSGAVRTAGDVHIPAFQWALVNPSIHESLDALWVRTGPQAGFYSGLTVGWDPMDLSPSEDLIAAHTFRPAVATSVAVGSRSLGSARFYFLEPTSVEVGPKTVLSMTTSLDQDLRFHPDPTRDRQIVPALPNASKPLGGEAISPDTFQDASKDFIRMGIREGDTLIVDFQAITGTQPLADPVPGLALQNLFISLDNQPGRLVTFVNDVATPGAVSRAGVAAQINRIMGMAIADIVDVGSSDMRLQLNPTLAMSLHPESANVTLGFLPTVQTNTAVAAGSYTIRNVGTTALTLDTFALTSAVGQQYSIRRSGSQRICATEMAENVGEAGLYYWDVELVSEGVGDLWNIDANETMTATGYKSDGYYLTTKNSTLTFSPAEEIQFHVSRSILGIGVDDSPENSTLLSGQNLAVTYEYSSLVSQVQHFISADSERVINQSPLARYLVPHFVRFDLTYRGGSKESEVTPAIRKYIKGVLPDERLESSDLQKVVSDKGATSITNPIDIMAVVHNTDRTVTLVRSQDGITTGRLAAFIPDVLRVTRRP